MAVDFGNYSEHYLREWDVRATVRTRRRYRLTADAATQELYPERLLPVLKHPEIVARGEEARRKISVLSVCAFQDSIAGIEVDVVAGLCARLASDGAGVPLPPLVRQVALTIGTDEVYHAFVAREFMGDIERFTGTTSIGPGDGKPPLYGAVARLQEASPAGLRRSAETMALCIAEHFVTEELFGVSKDTVSDSPFHFTLREHLSDEGRHQVFFRHLMRHLWESSEEEARIGLGQLIPGFLDAFLYKPDFYWQTDVRILGCIGFSAEDSRRIVAEANTAAYGSFDDAPKASLPAAQHPLKLMKVAGVLHHPPTRELLIECGWLLR